MAPGPRQCRCEPATGIWGPLAPPTPARLHPQSRSCQRPRQARPGIAGPGGGSEEKPVGLVYIALADGKKPEVLERKFPGDRERVRMYASQQALDMVRRKLI